MILCIIFICTYYIDIKYVISQMYIKLHCIKRKMVEVSIKCHLSHHSGHSFYRVAAISSQVYDKDLKGVETREKQPVFMADELSVRVSSQGLPVSIFTMSFITLHSKGQLPG